MTLVDAIELLCAVLAVVAACWRCYDIGYARGERAAETRVRRMYEPFHRSLDASTERPAS